MKRTLLDTLLTILGLILCRCEEEKVILPSPSIEISSIINNGLTSYDVSIVIQRGEGQIIEEASLVLEDITVPTDEALTFKINFQSEQEQAIETTINTNRLNHDFIIEAYLKTNYYTYTSGKQIIRSPKNNYFPWFLTDDLYAVPEQNLGLVLNSGNRFSVIVDYNHNFVPKAVAVKLNETYLTESSIDFSPERASYGSNIISSYGSVILPKTVPPGVYSVDLYLDGHHFVFPNRVKVLNGYWTGFSSMFPGEKRGDYAWFILNDKLYLAGGCFYNSVIDFSPVWEFDLKNNVWTRKNNFPHLNPDHLHWMEDTEIIPSRLQTGSAGYVMVRYPRKVELWKYAEAFDSWEKISDYPGTGEQYLITFTLDGYLYAGGGIDNSYPGTDNPTEFFRVNLNTLQWERINDLPGTLANYYYFPVCTCRDKAYCLEPNRTFWEYDTVTDQWVQKRSFPGPWRLRSQFISHGDDLYLIGGEYHTTSGYSMSPALKDFWKYSVDQDQWEQLAFLPAYISRGIAFSYQDQIYAGLGNIIESAYYNTQNQYIYQYRPENLK